MSREKRKEAAQKEEKTLKRIKDIRPSSVYRVDVKTLNEKVGRDIVESIIYLDDRNGFLVAEFYEECSVFRFVDETNGEGSKLLYLSQDDETGVRTCMLAAIIKNCPQIATEVHAENERWYVKPEHKKGIHTGMFDAYTQEELGKMPVDQLGAMLHLNCASMGAYVHELKNKLGKDVCAKIKWREKPQILINTEADRQDGSVGSSVCICVGDVIGAEEDGAFLSFDPLFNVFALYRMGEYLSSTYETNYTEITNWVNKTYKK